MVWKLFRERFRYHAQVIALGAREADGSRTIVISEPPPWISLDDIKDRYRGRILQPAIRTNRIGFDGWVKDIVGRVPAGDEDRLTGLVQDLSRDLFGTSYKAYAVEISGPPDPEETYDLKVGSADLRRWFALDQPHRTAAMRLTRLAAWLLGFVCLLQLHRRRGRRALASLTVALAFGYASRLPAFEAPAGPLKPLHGGDPVSLRTLLEHPAPGVYVSGTQGFTVLVVNRQRPLNELAVSLREFSLDSDVVLGAVGSTAALAIVGRERQLPITSMPPLRTETLLLLAAAGTDELSQSYERRNIFAGSIGSIHRDWAPIYLSKQLHDSEYGSLLNIADQLLKSWSEHGEIEYIHFPYPKPKTYPFATGLLEYSKASRITYNWNTKGVGYSDVYDGYDVLSFTRTGALPVDYLGEQDGRMGEAEDQGYEFFAGATHDPNLARVVQYAGLYQIFRHYGISASWNARERPHRGPDALLPMARRAVEVLADHDVEDFTNVENTSNDPEIKKITSEVHELHEALASLEPDERASFADAVAKALVRPRDIPDEATLTDETKLVFGIANAIAENELMRSITRSANGVAMLKYVAGEKGDPEGWIRTPSIVMSWQTGNRAGVGEGGHNLSSRISRLAVDEQLSPGAVRVADEGTERVLYYSPTDAEKMRGTVRAFARNTERPADDVGRLIEREMQAASAEPIAIKTALRLEREAVGGIRGFSKSPGVSLSNHMPWTRGGDIPASHRAVMAALGDSPSFVIVVERQDNAYLISLAGEPTVIEAGDSASALDAVASAVRQEGGGRDVHLHFKGVNAEQARAFTRVAEMHTPDKKPVTIRASIEGPEGTGIAMLGEIRKGRWRVADAKVRPLTEANGVVRNDLEFEAVLPGEISGAPLRLKILVAFEKGVRVTTELLERVSARIQALLRSFNGTLEDTDLLLASRRIITALRSQDESIANVRIRVAGQAGEVEVARRELQIPEAVAGL
jgi:hypothetical protein